jgi:hypothetical protein
MYNVFCKRNALRQKQSFLPSFSLSSKRTTKHKYLIVSHHLQPHYSLLLQLLVASQSIGDECQHRLTVCRFLFSLLLLLLLLLTVRRMLFCAVITFPYRQLWVCSAMVSPYVDIQSARLSKGCAAKANARLLPCVGSDVPPQLAGCSHSLRSHR